MLNAESSGKTAGAVSRARAALLSPDSDAMSSATQLASPTAHWRSANSVKHGRTASVGRAFESERGDTKMARANRSEGRRGVHRPVQVSQSFPVFMVLSFQ